MPGYTPGFKDRKDAGEQLAAAMSRFVFKNPVVYALPRGGTPVAAEIARALKAPLELVLVRKIGAPGAPEVALAAVVDGEDAQTVLNEDVRQLSGADAAYLDRVREEELREIERRRVLYLQGHEPVKAKGCTAIVVDDGLATGATAKAALRALRRQGAARVVLAVPVAPAETIEEMRREADDVICVHAVEHFRGVGAFYDDFHQLTDYEMLGILREAWAPATPGTGVPALAHRDVLVPPEALNGDLQVPDEARGLILFAHGSGSSRLSPRNRAVAADLNRRGFATLLIDLLTESEAGDRRKVFDIDLLTDRLLQAVAWLDLQPDLARLPLGLFGASTGAAAALQTAARLGDRAEAVVSRGGRPDLADPAALAGVRAATLLIVGTEDRQVIPLNRMALAALHGEKNLQLVPGASHLFEEPGALEAVMKLAGAWFEDRLTVRPQTPISGVAEPVAPRILTLVDRLGMAAEALPDIDEPDFAAAFDRYGDARVVLLGEGSHGTSEFYRARAAITRRLIERHGFDFVAVEADWPDAAAIDRHIRFKSHRTMAPPPFSRFPTWMWRNKEFQDFVHWLRRRNTGLDGVRRAAFYGLDLYNMRASMAAVLEYLGTADPEAAAVARERYACLSPWSAEPTAYGRAVLSRGYALCEGPVLNILDGLLRNALEYAAQDAEHFFDATQNARLVADAERYYRVMYYGSKESWNLRDRHMFDTLEQILAARGPSSKGVVWAHNSHVGDARFTNMGAERGEWNIGQLCRQKFGREAALIGFGCHSGTVMAASDWDEPAQVMAVTPSRPGSYEALCHQTGIARFLIDLRPNEHKALRETLRDPKLERYIGVIYRPATELISHYARSSLSDEYDGFVWFDRTRAVEPLSTSTQEAEDETYPFGL